MSHLDEHRRNTLMVRKLAEVRKNEIFQEYKQLRNTKIVITNTTICPICKHLIGDSVCLCSPDGIVTHAGCMNATY